MSNILDRAKVDANRFNSDAVTGFAQEIILTPPDSDPVNITGTGAKIYLQVNTDGNLVSQRKAHISVHEQVLIDADYPVRNANGEIDLKNHEVQVKDANGTLKKYIVDIIAPDEQLGLIIIFLENNE